MKSDKYFKGLSKNTFFLALASFFADISSEMLYPILPVYLSQQLKAGGWVIGLIEGVAQATQNIIQGFSGYFSDKTRRRKPLAMLGFLLSALSKPFIGVAGAWPGVLAARFSDRLGAGTRSAPRDALIAASVSEEHRGKAFGLEGFGDNLGAFVGPLITILLLSVFYTDLRNIFFLAAIPGFLAFLMVFLVKEHVEDPGSSRPKISVNTFPSTYWKYLVVTAVFGIGNSSNAFLILQIKDKGLSLTETVLVYAAYNLVAALISYPAGSLSDRIGRKSLLMLAFLIFIGTYLGFALDLSLGFTIVLFIGYGMFQGIFRAVGKSFAADFIPPALRASGIGWYSTAVGLSGLCAGIIAGFLWDQVSHTAVFAFGAIFAGLGAVLLWVLTPDYKQRNHS